jgi:hypothetical protein
MSKEKFDFDEFVSDSNRLARIARKMKRDQSSMIDYAFGLAYLTDKWGYPFDILQHEILGE